MLIGGGHTRSPLLLDLYAETTGALIAVPRASDVMVLGAGMLAAVAAGQHPSLAAAAAGLDQGLNELGPRRAAGRYDREYRILLEMQRQRRALLEML